MLMFSDEFHQWAGFRFEEFKSICQKISRELDLQQEFIDIGVAPDVADAVAEGNIGEVKRVTFNSRERFHSVYEFAYVAAHEMRHIWQYANKVFSPWTFYPSGAYIGCDRFGVWKNCLIFIPSNKTDSDHFCHPFEIDANEYAHRFVSNIEADRENSKETFWSGLVDKIMGHYEIYGFNDTLEQRKASKAYHDFETVELAVNQLKHHGCEIEDY
jgi:hypothetical protein